MALVRVLSVVGYFALPPAFFIGFALLSGGLEGYGPLHAASFACGITSYLMFCLQFVLAARPRLLERAFGLDALFRFHAGAAPAAILLAVAHGQFLVLAQGKAPGYLPYTLGGIALTAYAVLGIAAVLLLGGARVGGIHAVARMRSIAQRAGLDYGRSKVFHNASLIVSAVACVHALAVPVVAYSSPLRLLFALPFAAAFCFWLRHKAFRSGRSFGIVAMEREAPRVTMLRVRALDEYSWKPFRGLRAGQFAFIRPRIPGLGREFHPFTIAGWDAGSHELVFRIKAVGDWTMRLLDSIPSFPGERGDHPWTVALDGPCGRFCLGDRMPKGCEQGPVVCIAGGIGVTPFLAMAAEELQIGRAHV